MSTASAAKSKIIATLKQAQSGEKISARKRSVKSSSTLDIGSLKEAPKTNTKIPSVQQPPSARSTKQEIVLTLLYRPDGACIDEIMQATNWQRHSVRGFLAGTVKRKLGFTLISSKNMDEERRYRIEQKRRR